MKPGSPPPPPPDDEAADPLLTALRERLGDYGQAPPPGAWAAIRRQVASAALPQPWWRRRPPLVLLGLLLCCLLPGKLGEYIAQHQAGLPAGGGQPQLAKQSDNSPPLATAPNGRVGRRAVSLAAVDRPATATTPHSAASSPATFLAKIPVEATSSLAQTSSSKNTKKTKAIKNTRFATTAASHATASLTRSRKRPALASVAAPASQDAPEASIAANTPHRKTRSTALAIATRLARRRQPNRWAAEHPHTTEATAAGHAAETLASTRRTVRPASRAHVATHAAASRTYGQNNTTKAVASFAAGHASRSARSKATYVASASSAAARRPQNAAHGHEPHFGAKATLVATDSLTAAPTEAAASLTTSLTSGIFPFGPVDLLALKQSGLLLPVVAPPATLVARPDSAPAAHPARRWALLLVAGPTLSYRTLGAAPTLAAGRPDFARLERPALGLSAQVQVRRVLSGRWALAVGLGYHEYATGLALSLKDSASVHQRDTYRLLTVPVQVGYALGAPKGRFSKALLLGAEPGWYLGGRSTEGSGCGCEQQTYTAAASSPYRSLSLAFSLGFDLRYRLGSPGSRWQWLVQPTGRYVATPFVRNEAVGFTQRQPFSLGLVTGFSWDVR